MKKKKTSVKNLDCSTSNSENEVPEGWWYNLETEKYEHRNCPFQFDTIEEVLEYVGV